MAGLPEGEYEIRDLQLFVNTYDEKISLHAAYNRRTRQIAVFLLPTASK